jgi:signal transduction histidine kinase
VENTTIRELQSKLAAATEALQKSEERATAGQLALEVMHEVRNPLEALGHIAYLATEEANNPEEVRRYMRLAEEQLDTLNHIARYTLSLARTSVEAKPVDLVAVAEAALRIHQRKIEAKKIHLVRRLPEQLPATVHAGEILQVLSNLVMNALDALPEEGSLYLRLHRSGKKVRLMIADNGCGIPKDSLPKIFQPFFTTKGEQGTGLGLSLSSNIIERHHGRIGVRSQTGPGKSGTAFLVSIPA